MPVVEDERTVVSDPAVVRPFHPTMSGDTPAVQQHVVTITAVARAADRTVAVAPTKREPAIGRAAVKTKEVEFWDLNKPVHGLADLDGSSR
jgi:hypothetical protein